MQVAGRPFHFKTAASMRDYIGMLPEAGGEWQHSTITPRSGKPRKPAELFWRDPLKVVKQLLADPAYQNHLSYVPVKVFNDASSTTRQYNEMWTGNWWWRAQVRQTWHPCSIWLTTSVGADHCWWHGHSHHPLFRQNSAHHPWRR